PAQAGPGGGGRGTRREGNLADPAAAGPGGPSPMDDQEGGSPAGRRAPGHGAARHGRAAGARRRDRAPRRQRGTQLRLAPAWVLPRGPAAGSRPAPRRLAPPAIPNVIMTLEAAPSRGPETHDHQLRYAGAGMIMAVWLRGGAMTNPKT